MAHGLGSRGVISCRVVTLAMICFVAAPDNSKEDPRELMPESEGAKDLKVCRPLHMSNHWSGACRESRGHSSTHTLL